MLRVRQVALGVFILWQAAFLVLSLVSYVAPEGALRDALDAITQPYARAFCQYQGWQQFSPNIVKRSLFDVVELRHDDDPPLERRSDWEPPDPSRYVHLVLERRVAVYATAASRPLWGWDAAAIAREPERYRRETAGYLRMLHAPILAYLNWQRRTASPPPRECVVHVRVFDMPSPDGPFVWAPPDDVTLMRVRWDTVPPPGMLAIEMFDPLTQGFAYVPERE